MGFTLVSGAQRLGPFLIMIGATDMVYVAGGVLAVALIGYGGYKVYKYVEATHAAESAAAGGDAGAPQ